MRLSTNRHLQLKQIGPTGRVKVRGLDLVEPAYVFGCTALNLLRLIAQERIQGLSKQCA